MIFFYVSVSSVFCGGEKAIRKLHRAAEIFLENRDRVGVVLVRDPGMDLLKGVNPELFSEYEAEEAFFREVCGELLRIDRRNTEIEERNMLARFDAYYGAPDYFAELFSEAGKPVMIWDVEI